MINEIRYEIDIATVNFSIPTVFLAGPTVRGNQPHLISWRFRAIDIFKNKVAEDETVNLIIPEFTSKTESDEKRFDLPLWEFTGLQRSKIIMFWIPRTRELIGLTTNHEHGYWMGRDRNKIVYGRPDDTYRMAYLDIMWREDATRTNSPAPIHNTMESTIDSTLERLRV